MTLFYPDPPKKFYGAGKYWHYFTQLLM